MWILLSLRKTEDRMPDGCDELDGEHKSQALYLREFLKQRLTPAQIAQAEQRAQEWQPREPTSEEITALVAQVREAIEKKSTPSEIQAP